MTIPILMYHHVNPVAGDMVTVTPERLDEHLAHITGSGYRTITLAEAVAHAAGGFSPAEKCVALTFDDGYLDNFVHAWPLIRKYNVRAAIFLVTGWVDGASAVSPERRAEALDKCRTSPVAHAGAMRLAEGGEFHRVSMDWDMAAEMASSGLVEFYSHTVTHRSCDRLEGSELAAELTGSKAAIEERLGTACPYICWPKGRYSATAIEAAKDAGYEAAFTTRPGVVSVGDDPMELGRIVVKDGRGWLPNKLRIYTSSVLSSLYLKVKGR